MNPFTNLPRRNSPTRTVELAVKAAQEDICAIIHTATAVLLLAEKHWIVGGIAVILALVQWVDEARYADALKIAREEERLLDEARHAQFPMS